MVKSSENQDFSKTVTFSGPSIIFMEVLILFVLFSFEEFENLGKAFSKAKAVVDKEGIPQFYIRGLAELEDFVKEVM